MKPSARRIKSINGERLVILVDESGMPLFYPALYVTEYGYCVHDFSMLPCQKHRDCLNCNEQVCVKGDEEKLERSKKTT